MDRIPFAIIIEVGIIIRVGIIVVRHLPTVTTVVVVLPTSWFLVKGILIRLEFLGSCWGFPFFASFPGLLQLLKDPTSSASSEDYSASLITGDCSTTMDYFTASIASSTDFITSIYVFRFGNKRGNIAHHVLDHWVLHHLSHHLGVHS